MKMCEYLKNFASNEDGAVTVDWVVLTAAVVGLSLALMSAIKPAITSTANNIKGSIIAAQNTTTP
jgi:Flp pilus assembly pilin Flp